MSSDTIGLIFAVGVATVTVVIFFVRLDFQLGRVVDLLKDMREADQKTAAKLERIDRRLDRISQGGFGETAGG